MADKRYLASFIVGGAIVGGDGNVVGSSLICGAVEVIERRCNEHETGRIRVDPGGRSEDVLLALAVVDARSLHGGIVRHLVVVEAKAGIEAKLVFGIGIVDERSECAAAAGLVVQIDGWSAAPDPSPY